MTDSLMKSEALQAPEKISFQLNQNNAPIKEICKALHSRSIQNTLSIARGSSDHAAQFLNFLIMEKIGLLPCSLSMSILTYFKAKLKCEHSLALAISQSGQSPDLWEPMSYFRAKASATLSFVNERNSRLEKNSEFTIPLHAGPEESVAATKSYLCSLSAAAHFCAHYTDDRELLDKLFQLPERLKKATQQDWSYGQEVLKGNDKLFVSARGHGLSLAYEAALKFKETCSIQAEGFSSAEIQHGPQALIKEGYPLLIFALSGPTQQDLLKLSSSMKERGAKVILAAPEDIPQRDLTIVSTGHHALDTISAALSFYLMVEQLSKSLDLDPDSPHYLAKVTMTR